MMVNLNKEVRINFKNIFLGIISAPFPLFLVAYITGEVLYWCSGMFPSTAMECSGAPFFQGLFTFIYQLMPLTFLLCIVALPAFIILIDESDTYLVFSKIINI